MKTFNLRNTFLELLLFIDALFTETAKSFLILDFNNNIFVSRSSHFIKCFKKPILKVSVYPPKLCDSQKKYVVETEKIM